MAKQSVAELVASNETIISLVDVTAALSLLGLAITDVHEPIDAGEVDRDACTANNPPTDAGSRAHGTTIRVLRERLIPRGWTACNDRNFSTVVSPDEGTAIAVASGCDGTGDERRAPRTKNRKGELVLSSAEENKQLLLDLKLPPLKRTKTQNAKTTWLLLRERIGDSVRCELSIPLELGDDERVCAWGTRIILPDLGGTSDGGFRRRTDDHDAEKAEPVEIPVVRRSA